MPSFSEDNLQKQRLQACLKKIENHLGWGDSIHWRHRNFELLSDKIFDGTDVRLSAVTLKRLWGRIAYTSHPSTSTLDTLAQFAGFDSWIAFVKTLEREAQQVDDRKQPAYVPFFKWLSHKKVFIPIGILLVVAIGLIVLTQSTTPLASDTQEEIKFDFEPVTQGLPNTVTFTYDVSHTDADSVFIQQSWDPRLRHQVDKKEHFFATTYYYPGSFQAKLILNDQVIQEKNLIIESGGWLGTIEKNPVPFYLPYTQLIDSGKLVITPTELFNRGYDFNEDIPFTNLHLVEDFSKININDFHLTTIFKNTLGQGHSVCQKTNVMLLCEDTPFIIPFSIKGCVGELGLIIPGKYVDGQQNDLSGFGVDFSDWVRLDVKVVDHFLDIQVNKHSVFQDSLAKSSGKLAGIRYQFHGTGAVKHLEIKSEETAQYVSRF